MGGTKDAVRFSAEALDGFIRAVFEKLRVPSDTAGLAARTLIEASLMGVDTHGVEALDMYVDHLRAGGLDPKPEPVMLREQGALALWDMQDGFGLAGARRIMEHAMRRAPEHGVHFVTCRRTNHIGACGVYARMAADKGLIAMVSQETRATFAPVGGRAPRVGTSPFGFAAPVAGGFPFVYDASFAVMTRSAMKAYLRAGKPLPDGVATDAEGEPTVDAVRAWTGQIMAIGLHRAWGWP